MERIMPLLLLSMCARAHCEPLLELMRRRSDSAGVYAGDFAHDYEPVAFAAIPLHSPLPVLHIVSSAPLLLPQYPPPARPHGSPHHLRRPSPSFYNRHGTSYSQQSSPIYYPHSQYNQLATSYNQLTTSHGHAQPQVYAASMAYSLFAEPPVPAHTTEEAPTVLYARPRPQGGYTYHKKPTKKRNAPKKPEPVIIRVHKYRVLKGR